MNRKSRNPGQTIERAVSEIRQAGVSAEQVQEAAGRVLARLQAEQNKIVVHPAALEAQAGERIRSCDDFQSLIPAYLSSSLTASRRLLFEDHIGECVACRKAADGNRNRNTVSSGSFGQGRLRRPAAGTYRIARWAVAAALVLSVGIFARDTIRNLVWPIDVHAVAQTVNGGLYRVSGQDIRAVAAGERIDRRQAVRTGNNSGAVLELADGSRIEMDARSEVSLERAPDGVRIQLARGSVIVTAAKQRTGHLYVGTADCTASVVGTVFSVSAGTKGSRVSVLEGEVHVQKGSDTRALLPGQQLATGEEMGTVPLSEEIAWSRDRDLHLAMLKEAIALSRDIENRIGSMEMRHSSNLVGLVPADALILASLPNVSQPLAESYEAMKQRIHDHPALNAWWSANTSGATGGITADEVVGRVARVGAYLGSEIILALSSGKNAAAPLLLAETSRSAELVSALADDLARVANLAQGAPSIRVVQSAAELDAMSAGENAPLVYVDQQLMAVGTASQVRAALAARGNSSGFASTDLGRRVAQAYNDGVGWLLAADLHRLKNSAESAPDSMGVGDVQQLVVEQRTGSGGASYQAVLGFNRQRTGIAAWLAEPGSIGAAQFVSPNATGAAAIVTRDPALILDDIFSMVGSQDSALKQIQEFQREHHVDLRYDLAAPLGNEFLVAVDGPILPVPAWKLVIEVNDAARLQNSLSWAVSEINREAAASQSPGLTLSTEMAGGVTFYALRSGKLPVEAHYAFWAGYLIVAPKRSLVQEAIEYHDSGLSLARSDHFRSQFPADGRDQASGFVYQNLQAVASMIPVDAIRETVGNSLPTLVCLYGGIDKIMLSSKGVLGTNVASLTGLAGMARAVGIK